MSVEISAIQGRPFEPSIREGGPRSQKNPDNIWTGVKIAAHHIRAGRKIRHQNKEHHIDSLGNDKKPTEIALEVLKFNSRRGILEAGSGHFDRMWLMDVNLAAAGVLNAEAIGKSDGVSTVSFQDLLAWGEIMLDLSYKSKKPYMLTGIKRTAILKRHKGVDNPYPRVDSVPSLVHIFSLLQENQPDGVDVLGRNNNKDKLQEVIVRYENIVPHSTIGPGLVDMGKAGDWMDTITRKSSAWSNLWQLQMLNEAKALGLQTQINPEDFAKIFEHFRWVYDKETGRGYFADDQNTDRVGVDANVVALYLGLYPDKHEAIINQIESMNLFEPAPMVISPKDNPYFNEPERLPDLTKNTAFGYHDAAWMHVGNLYTAGLLKVAKREIQFISHLQTDTSIPLPQKESLVIHHEKFLSQLLEYISLHKKQIDDTILQYGNVVETIDRDTGKPYRHKGFIGISSEEGLSMAAGTYVEVVFEMNAMQDLLQKRGITFNTDSVNAA